MGTPMAGTRAPGFFRLKVGSYEVTVLSDGGLALDAALFAGDEAGKEKCLTDAHLPTTGIPTSVNQHRQQTGSGRYRRRQEFCPNFGSATAEPRRRGRKS